MKPASKRFKPSRLAERLIPVFLVLLLTGLLVTILIVILSVLGVIPA